MALMQVKLYWTEETGYNEQFITICDECHMHHITSDWDHKPSCSLFEEEPLTKWLQDGINERNKTERT